MLKLALIAAVAAVVVFFLSVGGISYLSSPPSDNPSQQQAGAKKENGRRQEKQHTLRGFIRSLFPDPISFYTFWLMLATIILGIVAIVQIGYLRRAETIAANTAQAAKDSAAAAKNSAEAYNASQRAFVVPDGLKWYPTTDNTGKVTWRFYATWRNSGNTPTRNLKAYIVKAFSIGIADINDPLGPQFGMTEEQRRLAIANFLGPKATMDSGPVTIDGDDLLRVQQNGTPFVIGGVATYDSIFPGDKPHITKFSWQIVTVTGNPKSAEPGIQIGTRTTRTNNCADDECQQP